MAVHTIPGYWCKLPSETQHVSNDAVDPDLNEGCAYFMEEKEYKKYLSEYKAEKELVHPIPIKHLPIPA